MLSNNCRVCGLTQAEAPWGMDGQTPSFDYCDCCGTQFGYQDCLLQGIKAQRERWINNGRNWSNEATKPKEWSFDKQKHQIPRKYQ
jgi:hypothetical protein